MNILRTATLACLVLLTTAMAYGQEQSPGPMPKASPDIGSLEFQPSQPRTGDDLKLKVAMGGSALRAEVRWSLNGEEVALSDCNDLVPEAALGSPIKAGDQIAVSVTPFNAENVAGRTVQRKITIGNAPPHIKLIEQKITSGAYAAKLEASDPEGDPVSFTLQQGPPGMSVDPNGTISWKFGQRTTGKFNVKVSAKDPQGGEAVLFYSFAIRRSGP